MNSVEGYKGFITFLILSATVGLSVFGFNFINKSSNTESEAQNNFSDPIEIGVSFSTDTTAEITWKTEKPTETTLEYSKYTNFKDSQVKTDDSQKSNTTHNLKLENLDKNTTYYYKIRQRSKVYPLSGDPYTFTLSIPTVAPVIREVDESVAKDDLKTESNTTETPADPESSQLNSDSKDSTDYGGFGEAKEFDPNNKVLGKSTNMIGENITKEFKEATLFQDMRYDFNNDSKVDTNDYPLFINFILNKED